MIERQRESALLRALGMQRAQLRQMLLIEAFALVGIGAVIGFIAGMFFGWLGLTTVVGMAKAQGGVVIDTQFALDPWWTLALIAVCVVAAVLASLLPGRKAANATPPRPSPSTEPDDEQRRAVRLGRDGPRARSLPESIPKKSNTVRFFGEDREKTNTVRFSGIDWWLVHPPEGWTTPFWPSESVMLRATGRS